MCVYFRWPDHVCPCMQRRPRAFELGAQSAAARQLPRSPLMKFNCSNLTDPPEKPTDVRCQTVQVGSKMSNDVTCHWNPGTRDPVMHTNYTLYIEE